MLCLGLDPDPDTLPAGFGRDLAGLERFAALLLEAAAPYAAAVKPNLAFFEAYRFGGHRQPWNGCAPACRPTCP